MKTVKMYDCPWNEAFVQVVTERQIDLDPVLMVTDDKLEHAARFLDFCKSRKDVLHVRLGQCSNWAYIGIELLLILDRRFVESKLKRKYVPHENVILHMRRKIAELKFRPIIVIDNCQYLNFNLLFRVLRMVNELEGKAMFVFLLPEEYDRTWEEQRVKNPRLAFFLKMLKHRMNLKDTKTPISLPKYLDRNFIVPSGQPLKWWAGKLSVTYRAFHTMMRGKQNSLSLPVILEFSNALNIPPEKLITIQNKFLLASYQAENAGTEQLKKIKPRKVSERSTIRTILSDSFLKRMGISYPQLAKQMKVPFHRITNFLNSLRHAYHDRDFLCRLGEALGTGGKFWLDLQTKQDLDQYLTGHHYLKKYFDWDPPKNFTEPCGVLNTHPPGSVLEENFLNPSGIPVRHWADFFCMSPETFRRVLDGRNLMDFRFIALLVKAFDKSASYWIDLQNGFLENKYLTEQSGTIGIKPLVPKSKRNVTTKLGSVLINEFLKPLGLTPTEFGKYIGGSKCLGLHLTSGHDRVGVEMAVKFSQALGTSPMYWLELQMECDLSQKNRKRRKSIRENF